MFTKIKNQKETKKNTRAIQLAQPTRPAIGKELRNNVMKSSSRTTAFVACVALSLLLVAVATGPFFLMQDADAQKKKEDGNARFCKAAKEDCLKEGQGSIACYLYVKYCT